MSLGPANITSLSHNHDSLIWQSWLWIKNYLKVHAACRLATCPKQTKHWLYSCTGLTVHMFKKNCNLYLSFSQFKLPMFLPFMQLLVCLMVASMATVQRKKHKNPFYKIPQKMKSISIALIIGSWTLLVSGWLFEPGIWYHDSTSHRQCAETSSKWHHQCNMATRKCQTF